MLTRPEAIRAIKAAAKEFNAAVYALGQFPTLYVDVKVDTMYIMGPQGGVPILDARILEVL